MPNLKIDFLENYDDQSILSELKRIAVLTGKNTVTKADLKSHGRVSYSLVNKRFGSLRAALQKAELEPTRFMKATDSELLELLVELWEKVLAGEGRTPQQKDLKAYGFTISADTIKRRFGTWRKALLRAFEYVDTDDVPPEKTETVPSEPEESKEHGPLSLRKRFFVLKRDGFTCVHCGANGPGVRLEVDHKVPVAKGGTDALDNLQTLCFECNRGKRDTLVT